MCSPYVEHSAHIAASNTVERAPRHGTIHETPSNRTYLKQKGKTVDQTEWV